MAVPAKISGAECEFGNPQELFQMALYPGVNYRAFGYQPTADGQRFLAILPGETASSEKPAFTIRINWQAGLKK
jgi:hypothetical protein